VQFRHLLDSPEQGLLVVPLFNDILPQSGGTHIATDSIGVVSRFLVNHPEGLHPVRFHADSGGRSCLTLEVRRTECRAAAI